MPSRSRPLSVVPATVTGMERTAPAPLAPRHGVWPRRCPSLVSRCSRTAARVRSVVSLPAWTLSPRTAVLATAPRASSPACPSAVATRPPSIRLPPACSPRASLLPSPLATTTVMPPKPLPHRNPLSALSVPLTRLIVALHSPTMVVLLTSSRLALTSPPPGLAVAL